MTTPELPDLDLSKKKKKKKTTSTSTSKSTKVDEVTEELEELEVNEKEEKKTSTTSKKVKKSTPSTEETPSKEEGEGGDAAPDSIDFGKKKKKKSSEKKESAKPAAAEEDDEDLLEGVEDKELEAQPDSDDEGAAFGGNGTALPWAGSDRDYTYEELTGRVYQLILSKDPDMGSKQKRYQMKPPQVCRDGTKKTVWLNFAEMCPILKRKPEHVLNYVLAELGAHGSLDGKHRLVIKGRFQGKQIEAVIRHYISEYVACRTCKSPDTKLKKENRLSFLCCDACGSTRSVASIKKGFEAQIGKRKKEQQ